MATLEELCASLELVIGRQSALDRFHRALNSRGLLMPGIGHEVIAHLAHHGLLSYIVDFNFDNLLESALTEEFGDGQLFVYRSEADFSGLLRQMNTQLSPKPILVKPHGAFPQDAAILVTPSAVESFLPGTYEVLSNILKRSNILVLIGYSAADPDFRAQIQQLETRTFNQKHIVWIEGDLELPDSARGVLATMGRRSSPSLPPNRFTHLYTATDANAFLERLGHECGQEHSLPDVTRHQIRTRICNSVVPESLREVKFIVELLIFAAKARGLLHLKAISSCSRLEGQLKELTKAAAPGLNAGRLIDLLVDEECLVSCGMGKKLYVCDPTKLGEQLGSLLRKQGWLRSNLDGIGLSGEFARLSEQFDIDVAAEKDPLIVLEFPEAKPIRSMSELTEKTEGVVNGEGTLLISTFRGEWLVSAKWERHVSGASARILLQGHDLPSMGISHDTFYGRRQFHTIETLRGRNGYTLRQNKAKEFELCATINPQEGAIVFRRAVASPIISPYFLSVGKGLDDLMQKFESAWSCGAAL